MKIADINIDTAVNNVRELLREDKNLSSSLKSAIELLLLKDGLGQRFRR